MHLLETQHLATSTVPPKSEVFSKRTKPSVLEVWKKLLNGRTILIVKTLVRTIVVGMMIECSF